ncbi:hypothetical protein UFOVP1290_479 [uncultured Caudovirales phage]|uniref:Uncharacterized protein n=1 Tax=uncultured Caudovirales phage TaxID=2100421 RepID=A0A6J5RIY0_9CAUD|nr:hypothetical protein UFOVP1290_479 [uncultured Caudovirales phage]
MIHGIYVKNRPKSKWKLFSITTSQECVVQELDAALKAAHLQGNENAEVATKIFESSFYIPEQLSTITDQKPLFN